MRKCKNYQKSLAAFLESELNVDIKSNLEQHLVTCPNCQKELQELKSTLGILEQEKKSPALEINESDFLVKVRSKIEKSRRAVAGRLVFQPKWLWVGLASVFVILLVGSLFKADISKLVKKDNANLSSDEISGENLAEYELNQLLTPETEESLEQLYIQLERDYYQKEDLMTVLADFSQSDFETLENKMKNINLNIK